MHALWQDIRLTRIAFLYPFVHICHDLVSHPFDTIPFPVLNCVNHVAWHGNPFV